MDGTAASADPARADDTSGSGAPDDEAPALEVLLLRVGDERVAVRAREVREVSPAGTVTPLPGAPQRVRGLAAVRGALVPVVAIDARGGDGAPWWVVVDDGSRAAALEGARVDGLAGADVVDAVDLTAGEAPHGEGGDPVGDAAAAHAWPHGAPAGLPVRGAVRPRESTTAGAGLGLLRLARRTRRGARKSPEGAADTPYTATPASPPDAPARAVALLDVAALLDDLYDPGG